MQDRQCLRSRAARHVDPGGIDNRDHAGYGSREKAAAAVLVPPKMAVLTSWPDLLALLGRRDVLLADARVEFVEQFLHAAA